MSVPPFTVVTDGIDGQPFGDILGVTEMTISSDTAADAPACAQRQIAIAGVRRHVGPAIGNEDRGGR
jgi:hypothetical protein